MFDHNKTCCIPICVTTKVNKTCVHIIKFTNLKYCMLLYCSYMQHPIIISICTNNGQFFQTQSANPKLELICQCKYVKFRVQLFIVKENLTCSNIGRIHTLLTLSYIFNVVECGDSCSSPRITFLASEPWTLLSEFLCTKIASLLYNIVSSFKNVISCEVTHVFDLTPL